MSLDTIGILIFSGQRALVAHCLAHETPPLTAAEALAETRDYIQHVQSLRSFADADVDGSLVQPTLAIPSPIACPTDVFDSIADFARSQDPPVALHLHSPQDASRVDLMRKCYPDYPSSAHLYYQHGLLDSRTIYPYFFRLEPTAFGLIKKSQAGVSLCPNDELTLDWDEDAHGVFKPSEIKVRWCSDEPMSHVQLGLGTSCPSANSPSVLSVARQVLYMPLGGDSEFRKKSHIERLTDVFYMATLGGAELCGLERRVGNFEPGKELDALIIAPRSPNIWWVGKESVTSRFQRWVQCGDDRDIYHVYVRGMRVGGAGPDC